jgi:hypothetical protein
MDPDAALARIRVLAKEILRVPPDTEGEAIELAETIDGLDGWLSRGGFLPTDWSAKR